MRELSTDLREFIHLLNTSRVKYMLVGAWALALHARPRYTADVDVFVERSPENAGHGDPVRCRGGRHRPRASDPKQAGCEPREGSRRYRVVGAHRSVALAGS